jgi:hypothetical protein
MNDLHNLGLSRTRKLVLYKNTKNCLHMNLLKRPFVNLGISLLLLTHITGCDILLTGDCTNQPFEPFLAVFLGSPSRCLPDSSSFFSEVELSKLMS